MKNEKLIWKTGLRQEGGMNGYAKKEDEPDGSSSFGYDENT